MVWRIPKSVESPVQSALILEVRRSAWPIQVISVYAINNLAPAFFWAATEVI